MNENIQSPNEEIRDIVIRLPRQSALVCWPVEWLEGYKPPNNQLHVTAAFIPNVLNISKNKILTTLRVACRYNPYRIAKIKKPGAFGLNKDIPVLMVEARNYPGTLLDECYIITRALNQSGISISEDFEPNPHVTVDLTSALNPPSEVLLRPLELWYRDEEPVVI